MINLTVFYPDSEGDQVKSAKYSRLLAIVIGAVALALFSSCGGSNVRNEDVVSDNGRLIERTIHCDVDDSITLTTGARVDFPANTLEADTIVLFSDELLDYQQDPTKYPTGATGVMASITLNSPIDHMFHRDVTVTWDLLAQRPLGERFLVYKYDEENGVWVLDSNEYATVNGNGKTAATELHSAGVRGFAGTYTIFGSLYYAVPPVGGGPTITGQVQDDVTHSGVQTSVFLYEVVGAIRMPYPFLGGRPITGQTGGGTFGIDADASGNYTITLPPDAVGLTFLVESGVEGTTYHVTDTPAFTVAAGANSAPLLSLPHA
jgi:hypothetical protein